MKKFTSLKYQEIKTKRINDFESSFIVQPLERGFGNTLGNAIRRVLLSSISGVAPFAIKINGVKHEFQSLPGVEEDVVQLILNLKKLRIVYNPGVFQDEEIITIKATNVQKGPLRLKDLTLSSGVEIVNDDLVLANISKPGSLNMEIFLKSGRGFVSYDKNKEYIKTITNKIESKIKNGLLIAVDSNFSPIEKVGYDVVELNSSSAIIEERLNINLKTDGSISAKQGLAQAAYILMSHLEIMSDITNLDKEEIFEDAKPESKKTSFKSMTLLSLDLSVRSYNCLNRAGKKTLEDLTKLTKKELKGIKNLGAKSVHEILTKLEENNIILEEGE